MNCPKCGSKVVPMSSGKGFRCAKPGNRWDGKKWSLCDGVIWNKSGSYTKKLVERAKAFPVIATPTDEQLQIRADLSVNPTVRGSRAMIINAGPGTGKTTTLSWATEAIYQRLGNLEGFAFLAFNVNAKDVLLSKLPLQVPDVFTLNGYGARTQGYQYKQYEAGKIRRIYRDMTAGIPKEDKQPAGIIPQIIERSRDLCLFNSTENREAWSGIIRTTIARFPGLAKKYEGFEDHVAHYLPLLALSAHAQDGTIDIQEQITRPVQNAVAKLNWTIKPELVQLGAVWVGEDVRHFATLIKAIQVPQAKGLVIDEAQDLSLCQIALFLAQAWRTGEIILIGDDKSGEHGKDGYKAGQAIYGWRGAFGGSLQLIARLWKELTGETAIERQLTLTHRCCPEVVGAFQQLNTVLRSSRPTGNGSAFQVSTHQAWSAWLNLSKGDNALWITRTNAPLAKMFLDTLRAKAEVCLRGGSDFQGTLDNAIAPVVGWSDEHGEYEMPLNKAIEGLMEQAAENEEGGEIDPNSFERFFAEIAGELTKTPELLQQAGITDGKLTVGNTRRFILFFASKTACRTLSTVYRCKGDEAAVVVVDDVDKFNATWNGDRDEAAACRHVAASRAAKHLLVIGAMSGCTLPVMKDEEATVAA